MTLDQNTLGGHQPFCPKTIWVFIRKLVKHIFLALDVLQYVAYLFLQVTPCQSLFDKFRRRVVFADISAGLHQRLQIIYTIHRSPQIKFTNCYKIDVCVITCLRIRSTMQNLFQVISECKEVALPRDSIGSFGKSLSSSNICIGSRNSETTNTAECFSVQRVRLGCYNLHSLLIRSLMLLIAVVNRAFLSLRNLKKNYQYSLENQMCNEFQILHKILPKLNLIHAPNT